MEDNKISKNHIYNVILLKYNENKSSRTAAKEINEVYGEQTVGKSTVNYWYQKFDEGDFSLKRSKEEFREGKIDNNEVKTMITERKKF